MSNVNGVTNNASLYTAGTAAYTANNAAAKTTAQKNVAKEDELKDVAAVYTPSGKTAETKDNENAAASIAVSGKNKPDHASIIAMLKAEDEAYEKKMQDMVKSILLQQGSVYDPDNTNIWEVLQDPDFLKHVDKDTIEKAKEDVSENGYYGVEKTSERILTFAKALAGDDPSKADKLIEAFKKGYKQAEKIWGGNGLPEISKKTYDAVLKKFDDWKASAAKTEEKPTTPETKTDDKTTDGKEVTEKTKTQA